MTAGVELGQALRTTSGTAPKDVVEASCTELARLAAAWPSFCCLDSGSEVSGEGLRFARSSPLYSAAISLGWPSGFG